jgi:hypothetical protein
MMARIRSIKPDFFRHEDLYEAEREEALPLRLAFAGLWTAADREGRFRWKPRELKLDCLPFDEVDFSRVLDALATRGFVVRYRVDGLDYGWIPTWHKHQVINNREKASELPEPNENNMLTRAPRVLDALATPLGKDQGEGKGKEGEGKGKEDAAPSAAAEVFLPSPEHDLYRRGKEVCGKTSGGLIRQVLAAKGGSVPLARAAVEQAATKENPREYLGAIIHSRERSAIESARERGDAW